MYYYKTIMYFIYLLLVFLISTYIYHSYLPYVFYFDENIFTLLMCLFYSIIYFMFN
jgi:hypothetical protein